MARRGEGNETLNRLRDWEKDSSTSERLAALLLRVEKYQSVDPSHPLGGPDGLKDLICTKGESKLVVGVYFPRGQQKFSDTKKKFESDLEGVEANEADGFVFITNQELRLSERDDLRALNEEIEIDLYHLESVSSILNSPPCYGIRLDFLDIEMTKEEQLAYNANKEAGMLQLENTQQEILSRLDSIQSGEKPVFKIAAQTPFRVTPQVSTSMISGSMYGEQVHRCSNCGFGYIVEPQGNAGALAAVAAFSGGITITCPSCGNIENYTGGWPF